MTISIVSFNDKPLNDGAVYSAVFEGNPFSRTTQTTQVQPPGSWPRHIRSDMRPRQLDVLVSVLTGTVTTRQRELAQWFAPGTEGRLVIDEDGTQKELNAVATGLQQYGRGQALFIATLVAADPRWRGTLWSSGGATLATSGSSFTFTNPGNAPIDDAVITIRPVSAKAASAGWLYKLESIIASRCERPMPNYAIEMTENWDHATEVSASRSQSDADDVRVLVDGTEQPRWLGEHADHDANDNETNIWANFNYSPRRIATLLNAITTVSPGPDEDLLVAKGGTLGWPRSGALLIDDEVILYRGRTESNSSGYAAFTGVTRGARNTTIATHSASTTMYYVEHRPQIIYGHTGASAPAARNDLKPLLDLTSTTTSNVRHEWINFADSTYPGRSMQWLTRSRTFDDQYDKILAPTASPVTALTWEYQSGGAVAGKPVGNTYYRDFPTGTGDSGGNVASITRVLADTLGMWVYGIDNSGQDVVLQKFAGALTSASANITAPTNPVYRLECWAFNQVLAASQGGLVAGTPMDATSGSSGNGQQVTSGGDATDIVAVTVHVADDGTPRQLTMHVLPDSGSDAPVAAGFALATATAAATSGTGGTEWNQSTLSVTNIPATTKLWLQPLEGGAWGMNWYVTSGAYPGGKHRVGGTNSNDRQGMFKVMGRPAALAETFERYDDRALADDGDTVVVDGVTVHLSSTETPYMALKGRQNIYRFATGTLYNETTGQSIVIDATCALGDELRIDIGSGECMNPNDENGTSFAAGVTYSDPDAKFTLAPGANVLRFVETGMTSVNVSVDAQAAWE